jgi:ribonuclease P protein subunit RPR2
MRLATMMQTTHEPAPRLLALAVGGMALLGAGWAWDARRRAEEERLAHRTLVDVLLNALSADEPETARHSRRVADLAYSLAREARLSTAETAVLRVAALLHDLGKMDDRFFDIVHSARRLTAEQRREMEQHPVESAEILGPLERIFPGIRAAVESHHECWDGSGYPHGLAGEEIPLAARIISVADVFDALTQPRAYRGPLPLEEARAEIHRGAGTKFDRRIVALLDRPRLRREWEEIVPRGRQEEARAAAAGTDVHDDATRRMRRAQAKHDVPRKREDRRAETVG